jgi:Cys-tRNA synthase (O-phospho-L-seryl-tRNA:Cys-tRNA synthase)
MVGLKLHHKKVTLRKSRTIQTKDVRQKCLLRGACVITMMCSYVDLVKNILCGSTKRLHHEGQVNTKHEPRQALQR